MPSHFNKLVKEAIAKPFSSWELKQVLYKCPSSISASALAAQHMTAARGSKQKKFWGILSTAEVWYFVQYSRTDRPPFIVSQPLTVSMHNEASFNPLLDILYAFLLYAWSDATKENLESYCSIDPDPRRPRFEIRRRRRSLENIISQMECSFSSFQETLQRVAVTNNKKKLRMARIHSFNRALKVSESLG